MEKIKLPEEVRSFWVYLVRRGMTKQQSELICWLDCGYNQTEISKKMKISQRTVSRCITKVIADI